MSKPIIEISGLGKKYRIGSSRGTSLSLLDSLSRGAKGAYRRVKCLNRLAPKDEEFWALNDVSFSVEAGEAVGIIGRNGAGKSTLLKILSKITPPTTGEIILRGRMASLLEVGTGFHPELTGRENIYLNGAILGMTRAEIRRRFDEIVAFAEVDRFIDTPVKRYSSGMYVRLAFAVAAHLEPEILIVDEVLAVGDADFQRKCLGKMGEVGKRGRTIFFVSHNMEAIRVLCTKVIRLNSGKLVGEGEPSEQIEKYFNLGPKTPLKTDSGLVALGPSLQLCLFNFAPNPVEVGNSQDFRLRILSLRPLRIDALAILIFNQSGMRVAILDLRSSVRSYELSEGNPLDIQGTINSMALIEGEYHVGLYISTAEIQANFSELVQISVVEAPNEDGLIPYPKSVRGLVALSYRFHKNA